ncbi:GspH/FimT family pseudopilin [Stenotrophomonas sp. AB1(2024)]|uniref:GspH/FimT family pseudopilin n=1 Tax=Stenotrophomonas sp. AB1(2024) TaxID=3132215 RepID=UPI0030A1B23F
MSARRSNGFTLVELMITLVVVGVVAAIAFPNFQSLIRSSRVAAAHNELIGMVNLARNDAIRNNQGGVVCGSSDGATCNGQWGDGMMVFSDNDADGAFSNGETVLRYTAFNSALAVNGPDAPIAFDARGRRRAGANQTVTLRPVKCGEQPLQSTMTINASGQVTTVKGACQ